MVGQVRVRQQKACAWAEFSESVRCLALQIGVACGFVGGSYGKARFHVKLSGARHVGLWSGSLK